MTQPTASATPGAPVPATGVTTPTVRKITGAAGVGFTVFLLAEFIASQNPPGTDAIDTQVELFAIHHYHSLQVSLMLGAVALFFFVVFCGHLSARMRRTDAAGGDAWAPTFLVGAIGAAVLSATAGAVQGALQELSHSGDVAQILDLFHVTNGLAAASGVFLAVALVSVGLSGLLNGTVPIALSWLALVTAFIALASAGGMGTARSSFGTLHLVTIGLLGLWVLGLSIWLLVGRDDPGSLGTGRTGSGGVTP